MAIAYNTHLLDKATGALHYSNGSQIPQSLSDIMDQLSMRQLSTQLERKHVRVVGDSSGFTFQDLDNNRFQRAFQLRLKTLVNLFHLPVSVLFVNTAPLLGTDRRQLATLDTLKNNIVARTTNISVLTLELQFLSPHSFMKRVCTFLGLSCSLDGVDLATVTWSIT